MKRVRSEGDDHVENLDINMAHVLMLLSRSTGGSADDNGHDSMIPTRRVFECKTCNRRFPSFQALGGHRASHKKPRVLDDPADTTINKSPAKPRVHECSICGVEFALGQALGGHMRRHRVSPGSCGRIDQEEKIVGIKEDGGGEKRTTLVGLDLNLTPTENDSNLQLLTFSLGLPMVIL